MAGKKDGGVIGFDPLAWMKEPSPASAGASPASTTEAPAASAPDPSPQTPDAPAAVALGESLTIEQATALHTVLCRHLDARRVTLDAGALTRVDAAGLQLLTAFMREADGRGMTIEWRSPPALLREAARQLGLGQTLRLS